MNKELELTKEYINGCFEDTYHNFKILSSFFTKEILKISFIKLEFNSYLKCYEYLKNLFYNNQVIINTCNNILNYKNKEFHYIYEESDWDNKGKYHYINTIPTTEIFIFNKKNKYFLKYRILNPMDLLNKEVKGSDSP
jgi:hypothetical protein